MHSHYLSSFHVSLVHLAALPAVTLRAPTRGDSARRTPMNVFRRWGGWLFSRTRGSRFPNRVRLGLEILEGRLAPSVNPIVVENQLPGTPQSVWGINGAGDPSIQGFATDISVNHGQTISFKINDMQNAPYHIDIYRM